MGASDEPDIMTWFPRREDYEDAPVAVMPDETIEEKVDRLNETISVAQTYIKEAVDGNDLTLELKIYRVMDLNQDMDDLTKLLKECEADKGSEGLAEGIKKAKVGIINLKAYLQQVDVIEFTTAIKNEFSFKVGCKEGFGPWMDKAEKRMGNEISKPKSFEEALKCEEQACAFLKEVVKANKQLKVVQAASEGIRGNIEVQETMSKLQERYYVLCKKAEQRVKNMNHLLNEWKRLEDYLAPTNVFDMDDFVCKQWLIFLRTYAMYFG